MTRYDPRKHHRRSIRLPGYDYGSPGTYFVTICVQGRECLLGDVEDGQVLHSDLGGVVCYYWQRLARHFTHVQLDEWVVMPNHLHGIVTILERGEASLGRSSVRADARAAGGLATGRDSAGDAPPLL